MYVGKLNLYSYRSSDISNCRAWATLFLLTLLSLLYLMYELLTNLLYNVFIICCVKFIRFLWNFFIGRQIFYFGKSLFFSKWQMANGKWQTVILRSWKIHKIFQSLLKFQINSRLRQDFVSLSVQRCYVSRLLRWYY